METTLHRQLKTLYAPDESQHEIRCHGFRIDAIVDGELIEIQQAALSALRDKVRDLLRTHSVRVVKPLTIRKFLRYRDLVNGPITSSRFSPTRGTVCDLFPELVHFVTVFPHPRLTLELVRIDVEEDRVRKARKRWKGPDFRVHDRRLTAVHGVHLLKTAEDLWRLLDVELPAEFTTSDLARALHQPRWLAQKIAYCLRETGAAELTGKQSRALLYRRVLPVSPQKTPSKPRKNRKAA